MTKKNAHEQFNLFGTSTIIVDPKKIRSAISDEERIKRKEKVEAHIAWKLLKSRKFSENLTERHKFLLQKYYGIKL